MSADVERKGFLLFLSHWDIIGELPAESFKRVLQAVFSTVGAPCSMPEDMSLLERVAFAAVDGDVQRSLDLYDERRKRRIEAGRKGGRKKAENASKMGATTTFAMEVDHVCEGRYAINDDCEVDEYSGNASIATNESCESDTEFSKSGIATNASEENDAYSSNSSNATNARNASLANLANLHKDKDKAMATDKAKAMAIAKEPIKPLSIVDAAASDGAEACAAAAAPKTQLPLPSSASGAGTPAKRDINAHFETLWALYPSKRGKNQVTAQAKRRLMQVDTAAMETAIARYIAEVEAAPYDRQWLNGSTWFNGRYLDYLGDNYVPKPVLSGARPSARSRETSYRSAEEERARAARFAALEE